MVQLSLPTQGATGHSVYIAQGLRGVWFSLCELPLPFPAITSIGAGQLGVFRGLRDYIKTLKKDVESHFTVSCKGWTNLLGEKGMMTLLPLPPPPRPAPRPVFLWALG